MSADEISKSVKILAAFAMSAAALIGFGYAEATAEESSDTASSSDPGPHRTAATSPSETKPPAERTSRTTRQTSAREERRRLETPIEDKGSDRSEDDAPSTTIALEEPEPARAVFVTAEPTDIPRDPPAVAPQVFSVLGTAPRNDDKSRRSHRDTPSVSTSEPAQSGAVAYTAKPTFFDQIVVASLRIMRVVSTLIGIDINGQIGKLLESDRPPAIFTRGLDVRRNEYDAGDGTSWEVWEFRPPRPTGKTVIAVHGGGFVVQPLATHWMDYTNMARKTGATVLVPMYPLALTEAGTAVKVVPVMARYIADQIALRGARNVSIYADSAGPTLALAAVRELIRAGKPVPARMVLLSFAPDMSMSNPDIHEIDDPIIDLDNLDFYTDVNHWSDGVDPKDPLISPLFFEEDLFAELPPTTIYMGELEWSLPDAILLHDKWTAAGGTVSTVIGRGQIHDWALDGSINSQAAKVRPDIYRQLGLLTSKYPERIMTRRDRSS